MDFVDHKIDFNIDLPMDTIKLLETYEIIERICFCARELGLQQTFEDNGRERYTFFTLSKRKRSQLIHILEEIQHKRTMMKVELYEKEYMLNNRTLSDAFEESDCEEQILTHSEYSEMYPDGDPMSDDGIKLTLTRDW